MSHTDPIADMLTRIRNAVMVRKKDVVIPMSKTKMKILEIFKKEGFIKDYKKVDKHFPPRILVNLKYIKGKTSVIEGLQKISKPGGRTYAGVDKIPSVLAGLGVCVVSTSKGLLTGKECKTKNVGGEVILRIW